MKPWPWPTRITGPYFRGRVDHNLLLLYVQAALFDIGQQWARDRVHERWRAQGAG